VVDRAAARTDTSRRDLLKKVGIGAGVLVWTQPVVQAVVASPAAAMTPFCETPTLSATVSFAVLPTKEFLVTVDPTGSCGGACDEMDGYPQFETSFTSSVALKSLTYDESTLTWTVEFQACDHNPPLPQVSVEVTIICPDLQTATICLTYEIDFAPGCAAFDNLPAPIASDCPLMYPIP
jgi:hypothetical protein